MTMEDRPFIFSYAIFGANFSSSPGDSILSIKIVDTPAHGVLFWAGKTIVSGDEIAVHHGVISNFSYVPNANYSGFDTLAWNASDGFFYADQEARIFIKTIVVNDSPVLSNIESDPVLYALGDPAVFITKKLILSDVDDNFMFRASVKVVDNHNPGDLLTLGPDAPRSIGSSFDPATGVLALTGKESKSNYEMALNNILFSSPIAEDSTLSDKKISMVVNDSINDSNIGSRIIRITKVFPELSLVNAFTPNSDGVNDYWDFVNLEFYSEVTIAVFDQNGLRVFDCRDKDCKWDGKLKGKALPVGPYFYSIYLDRGKRSYRGTVTILR